VINTSQERNNSAAKDLIAALMILADAH
jgi:hypothetical protein